MIKCKRLQHHTDSVCSWVVSILCLMCQALNLGFSVSYGVLLPETNESSLEKTDRKRPVRLEKQFSHTSGPPMKLVLADAYGNTVKYCLDLGISADSASRLFIFLGLSSSVARIVSGRLCDVTWVNPILIYQFGDLLVGFATVVLPVIRSYTENSSFCRHLWIWRWNLYHDNEHTSHVHSRREGQSARIGAGK
ncbi:hypothetical protein OS493_029734 [Desmophyllum pertusum]|uniref:Uncharacterized protein n=1 Tax=Desmophyllum pertusum TaxID=174260 RepID=A0A9W9ZAC7_9CNID|nr:hypothetical protein OS493_029734 [Desmophyllum pertusum]